MTIVFEPFTIAYQYLFMMKKTILAHPDNHKNRCSILFCHAKRIELMPCLAAQRHRAPVNILFAVVYQLLHIVLQ